MPLSPELELERLFTLQKMNDIRINSVRPFQSLAYQSVTNTASGIAAIINPTKKKTILDDVIFVHSFEQLYQNKLAKGS